MNKTILRAFIASILTIMAVTSCIEKDKPRKLQEINDITWDTIIIKNEYTHEKADNATNSIFLKLLVPEQYKKNNKIIKSTDHLLARLLLQHESEGNETIEDAIQYYINQSVKEYSENIDELTASEVSRNLIAGTNLSYSKDIETWVAYSAAEFVSYKVITTEIFGEEGIRNTENHFVIDLRTGSKLTEENVFVESYRDILNQLLQTELLKKLDKTAEEAQEAGYWGVTDIAVNDNFYISHDGIVYAFNPGEYADENIGIIVIRIPYESIKELVKPEASIAVFVADEKDKK